MAHGEFIALSLTRFETIPLGRAPLPQHTTKTEDNRQSRCGSCRRQSRVALAPAPKLLRGAGWARQHRLACQPATQVFRQLSGGRISAPGLLVETLLANRVQVARQAGIQ